MYTFRRIAVLLCIFLCAFIIIAQEEAELPPAVQAFVDSFERVDDVGKLEVVQNSLNFPLDQLESFYGQVIKHVRDNSTEILVNTQLREMALLVLPRLAEGGFSSVNDWLWSLFIEVDETFWRIELLRTMAAVGPGDLQLVVDLADWQDGQNISRQAGGRPDNQVILQSTRTLGILADPVVYSVLIETVLVQYSAEISAAALQGIVQAEDTVGILANLVVEGNPAEKRELFTLYLAREEFTDILSDLSYQVLLNVLEERPNNIEERILLDSLRMDSVRVLSSNPQQAYAPALIRHFNEAIQSYDRGTADKGLVLEAIAALGQTDSVDSAIRLAEFLDLINTYTELDRPYDRQITLAIINNLRTLGKVEAYQPLFMVTILNYPNGVQEAAVEALAVLSQ